LLHYWWREAMADTSAGNRWLTWNFLGYDFSR